MTIPFADPAGPTLRDVLRQVSSAPSLSQRQRREICSALNTAARWFHRLPEEVPANHDFLRRAFARLSPIALKVSPSRVNNVRSLVKQGLCVAGVPTSGRSYLAPMNSIWEQLLSKIDSTYARDCLARFARFASTQGILPERVTDASVECFHRALLEEDMTAAPEIASQSLVRLWNRMVDTVAGWPPNRLTPRLRRETYTLRWDQLPPDFVADVEEYLSILSWTNPMHPLTPPRPLKPHSILTRRYQILQLVSGLHHQGGNINDLHSLADLCHPELVKQALRFFIDRHRARHGEQADVRTSMIGGIADTIRIIARHYARAPEATVAELTRIKGRLSSRQCGMTERNDRRLAQLDAPVNRRRFLLHCTTEMQKLARKSRPSREDALRYSVLLASEILIRAPMRSKNLAALDLDQHFIWPPRDTGDVGLHIPRTEVKNAQPLEYRLIGAAADALRTYIERFRPLLLNAPSRALFPSRDGKTKRTDTLSKQIKTLLSEELGLEWNVHLFRHFAAKLYLEANPGDYEGLRRLLGHTNCETTFRSYDGTGMRAVVEQYDRLLEAERGPPPPVKPRRQ